MTDLNVVAEPSNTHEVTSTDTSPTSATAPDSEGVAEPSDTDDVTSTDTIIGDDPTPTPTTVAPTDSVIDPTPLDGTSVSVTTTTGTALPTDAPPPLVKPPGGQGFNTTPTYHAKSEFDTQSLYLGLHQELIELDLFRSALANFTDEQFAEAGLDGDDKYLLGFMAEQEVGHATLISNMIDLDTEKPKQCTYKYPFTTVREFIDFSRLVTRWGESGTIGFLGHMDAQDAAALVNDAIQTEGRQQMVFRQWMGLFPMPFWFTTSITQSMQWTLLAPYIATCPEDTPVVPWTAFPALNVTNNPSLLALNQTAKVTSNETEVSPPGTEICLSWAAPGESTGWNSSYTTKTFATGAPAFAAWISQLNTTYTPLTDVDLEARTAKTIQPGGGVYGNGTAPLLNGTVYLAITDEDLFVTPYNLSEIESHVLAGPALYNIG
ncbi:hypothetical protein EXIGLDRAFT_664130 [Exidia glandulosa HHB12029]|uniref:Rds1 protein n=1 Tax=Exidia glandulosa HHB12029 TaxID=1314781 RepID=A0A165QFI7_EXIGL|nr:hypothetical protein EXIGLDRAFT_664130 [Exidia glandulosa HHB12029]